MKNYLQSIDSSTIFFFTILMIFLGLREFPLGQGSIEQNELNSEIFMPVTQVQVSTCQDKKDFETCNFSYIH